jgi:hypothetical protein
MEGTEAEPSDARPSEGKRRKVRIRKVAIIALVLVVLIVALAFILGGGGGSAVKPQFEIVAHSAFAEANTTGTFSATVTFLVNNTGAVPGNVTVIFKVKNGGYAWAGAQTFFLNPGQTVYSYKLHIPVIGDADDDWTYQCYINGKKAVDFPHD